MSKYYEVTDPTIKKLVRQHLKVVDRGFAVALAMAKRVGATACLCDCRLDKVVLSAFEFDKEPNKKLWKKMRGVTDKWEPRLTSQAGKSLLAEMQAIKLMNGAMISKLFKLPQGSVPTPRLIGQRLFLQVLDKSAKPCGCRRIADIAFERLEAASKADVNKQKKNKKKK